MRRPVGLFKQKLKTHEKKVKKGKNKIRKDILLTLLIIVKIGNSSIQPWRQQQYNAGERKRAVRLDTHRVQRQGPPCSRLLDTQFLSVKGVLIIRITVRDKLNYVTCP